MSDNKTKPPTEQSLKKARDEEGQVANSPDVTATVVFIVVLGCLTAFAAWGALRLALVIQMVSINNTMLDSPLAGQVYALFFQLILLCIPLALLGTLGGLIGVAIQGGVTMAFKKVTLKMEAVDPIAGLKRIFSSRTLVEGGKLFFKFVLFGALLWAAIRSILPMIVGATARPPNVVSELLWEALIRMMWFSAILIGILSVVDYKLQHWLFIRDKRMSDEDIKREYKEQNGNPEIKHKQKEFARELLEGPMPGNTKADVVFTNPTHYSVALSYSGSSGVPVVTAKGEDEKAFLIREWAAQEGVPMVEQPALARRLYLVSIGDPIPTECYQAVAMVLQWLRAIGRDEALT